MAKYNFNDEEIELDDDLQKEFGIEFSSSLSRHINNVSKKKNNNKSLKFHKDGYFDKNRK